MVAEKKYCSCKTLIIIALAQCLLILLYNLPGYVDYSTALAYLPNTRFVSYLRNKGDDSPPLQYTWLLNNSVFSQFNIREVRKKKRVTVLIIVSSAPRRTDRRDAIRKTWWGECKQVNKVIPECIFMTDHQNPGDKYYNTLQKENKENGDLRFQHVPGGITFGLRMLNHMSYALANYQFDYFMRVDDDYFFCLDKFLHEVPVPMVKRYHWGWVHCIPGITRAEESMTMYSNDIIYEFLSQDPNTILCHPWADQMIGTWSNKLNMTYLFRHDGRIHHTPIVSQKPELRNIPDICKDFMAIHGTYPDDMKLFWKHRGPPISEGKPLKDLIRNSNVCPIRSPFNWRIFINTWRYEPKRCVTKPTWDTSKQFVLGGAYSGRQGA